MFSQKEKWKLPNWMLPPHLGCQDSPYDNFSDLYRKASEDVIANSSQ